MLEKCIILMFSCAADRTSGVQQVNRDTWLKEWPGLIDHRFVFGRGNSDFKGDEWGVTADDNYGALQLKQREAYKRAILEGYKYVFVCFTDTYIHVPNLIDAFDSLPYTGRQVKYELWASGGCGYWLGAEALEKVADSLNRPHMQGDEQNGRFLVENGIKLVHDPRYGFSITRHLSPHTGGFKPEFMRQVHDTAV